MNMKSSNSKTNVVKAMRRTLGAGITATVALSAALSVVFAIALDGCSKSKNNKTEVSSSSTNSSGQISVPSPTPIGYTTKTPRKRTRSAVEHVGVLYNDSASGISYLYPHEFKPVTADKEPAPMNFALPGGVPLGGIQLPGGPVSSFFTVSVNKNLTPDQCGEFADPDLSQTRKLSPVSTSDESSPIKVSVGGVQFTKVETGTQELDTRYYHRYDHGSCYEFVMGVSEVPGNTKAVDHWERFDDMERILATVKIKSDVPTSVTAGVPSTPIK
jgi:hypothetical protein